MFIPKPPAHTILAFVAMASPLVAAHYDVYLLGGQSNGNGRADAAQLSSPLNAAQTDVFFYWHRSQSVTNVGHLVEDQWIDLAPGSGHGSGAPVYAKEFGCEVSFGRAMADAKPTADIAIIKYTHGGSNLYSEWAAGGSRYTTFVSTVQTALTALTTAGHTYALRGMLWQQGESDAGGSNADNYQTNLTSLISRVRTDVNGGVAFPFIIGSLSNSQYTNITTPGSGPYKVRQAQEAVAAGDPTVGIVITDGYTTRPSDSIHFDHDGQLALGQNFASQMLALEGPDVTSPQITGKSPADNASGVALDSNLVITFNESVQKGATGNIVIKQNGGSTFETIPVTDARVSVSGATVTINPAGTLSPSTGYHVQIGGSAIADIVGNPWSGIADGDTTTWNFTTALPANTIGTTGLFDENVNATNAVDVENPAATLAAFKTAVQTAHENDLGGVIDWETGVTATPSSGSASNNSLASTSVVYGASASELLAVTFDRSMELYTNGINGQVAVLSRQGSFHNAILPAGTSAASVLFTMSFSGAEVIELGLAMPSRTTFGAAGVDFGVTANFSGGGSSTITDTIGNTPGADDTFFRFAAPASEFITSLTIAYQDDNGQSLADGQRRPILDDFGFIVRDTTPPLDPADVLTTGFFDENVDATNAIDIEIPAGTLTAFKTAVQTAFNNNLGGVIDWETGVTATPSSGGTANNTLPTSIDVGFGTNASERLTITFDEPMALYTNNIAGQVNVLSQQGTFQNAIIPADANDVDYTMTFSGVDVTELGAAIPSRSTYSTLGADFRATASYSGGGSEVVDVNVGGTAGTGDSFLHFSAPSGESIASFSVAFLDDNGQGLTNGQRRPILDDFGFVVAAPTGTFSNWISSAGFGLDPSEQGFNDDPDDDGLANGLEAWFGTHPGEFTEGLANLATDGTTTTFTHPRNEFPLGDVTGSYQWSPSLIDWYAGDGVDGPLGGPKITIAGTTVASTTSVTAAASEELGKLFLRVVVVQD